MSRYIINLKRIPANYHHVYRLEITNCKYNRTVVITGREYSNLISINSLLKLYPVKLTIEQHVFRWYYNDKLVFDYNSKRKVIDLESFKQELSDLLKTFDRIYDNIFNDHELFDYTFEFDTNEDKWNKRNEFCCANCGSQSAMYYDTLLCSRCDNTFYLCNNCVNINELLCSRCRKEDDENVYYM